MKILFNQTYNTQIEFRAKTPKINAQKLQQLVDCGKSVTEICSELQITSSKYYSLLNEFGIQTKYKKAVAANSSITKEQITSLMEQGKKYYEICKELGISSAAYNDLLLKFNIVSKSQEAKNNITTITKEILETLVESGKKVKEICMELQISERSYSRLLDKFGIITPRKATKLNIAQITKEQLQKLVNQGFTPNEISSKLKINISMFYRLLKRFDISYIYEHHHKEKLIPKEVLEELAKSGKTTNEIAKILGISVSTFHQKAKNADVKTILRDSIDTIQSVAPEKIQALLDKRLSIKEICSALNITEANYIALIRKYNLRTEQRTSMEKNSKITKKDILTLKNSGKSVIEICKELNISQSTYKRILRGSKSGE